MSSTTWSPSSDACSASPPRRARPDHGAEAATASTPPSSGSCACSPPATPPLVLALDDLHLADPAALQLLELLLRTPPAATLLVLATYRDHELGDAHPLRRHPRSPAPDRRPRRRAPLAPLLPDEATQVVADALGCTTDEAAPLARAATSPPHARGNPAILRHLLLGLRREHQLRFDSVAGRWQWDESETSAAIISGDVATFIAARLQRLSPGVQRVLAIAASPAAPSTSPSSAPSTAAAPSPPPRPCARPCARACSSPPTPPSTPCKQNPDPGDREAERRTYQPLHDGILQAAARPPHRRRARRDPPPARPQPAARHRPGDDDLFAIVDHLGRGARHMRDPAEHERLARLHLEASRRARNATAYAAAVRHARAGLDALAAAIILAPRPDRDATARHTPPAATRPRSSSSSANGCTPRPCAASSQRRRALRPARRALASSELERAELYRLKAQLDTYHGRPHEAMAAGLAGLYRLGVELLPRPDAAEIEAEFADLQASLPRSDPAAGPSSRPSRPCPPATTREHAAIAELLAVVAPRGDVRRHPPRLPPLPAPGAPLAREHGPTRAPPTASPASASTSPAPAATAPAPSSAASSPCACASARSPDDATQGARILHIVGGLITGWTQPFAVAAATLEQGYEIGVHTGDFAAATYNTTTLVLVLVARRHSLTPCARSPSSASSRPAPCSRSTAPSILRSAIRMCRCLAGDLPSPDPAPAPSRWTAEVFARDLERDLSPLTLMYLHIYTLASSSTTSAATTSSPNSPPPRPSASAPCSRRWPSTTSSSTPSTAAPASAPGSPPAAPRPDRRRPRPAARPRRHLPRQLRRPRPAGRRRRVRHGLRPRRRRRGRLQEGDPRRPQSRRGRHRSHRLRARRPAQPRPATTSSAPCTCAPPSSTTTAGAPRRGPAPRRPSDQTPWIKRYRPVRNSWELGIYGGIFLPSSKHEFYDAEARRPAQLRPPGAQGRLRPRPARRLLPAQLPRHRARGRRHADQGRRRQPGDDVQLPPGPPVPAAVPHRPVRARRLRHARHLARARSARTSTRRSTSAAA
jgi:hypothetical protein